MAGSGVRERKRKLTPLMKQGIQLMVMDRWARDKVGAEVAKTLGVTRITVNRWRQIPEFKEEFKKQCELYRKNFDDVRLADRKERVKVLDAMFDKIPDSKVQLKLSVLQAIRTEVGDDRIQHDHTHTVIGVNIPPRADSYEEWLKQNENMQEVAEAPIKAESVDQPPLLEL